MKYWQHTYICKNPCVSPNDPCVCAFTIITTSHTVSSRELENLKKIKCWWSSSIPKCPQFEFDHSIPCEVD